MSGFDARPARRENVPLLIGLAGGTGTGKTLSALRIATGLAAGQPFVMIDTENGRAKFYADDFAFDHVDFQPPFSPPRYVEAIHANASYPVVCVDSASHEHAGIGGLLDWHEAELTRLAGDDWKRREAMTWAAWVKPKMAHKAFVAELLRLPAHVILCFRAEEKIEIVREDGKAKVVPKRVPGAGVDGWVPVAEKTLPYEMTVSLLLTPDQPGVPRPIKIPEPLRPLVPLDAQIDEGVGRRLAEWAKGPVAEPGDAGAGPLATDDDRRGMFQLAEARGVTALRVQELFRDVAGVEESRLIPRADVPAILELIEQEGSP